MHVSLAFLASVADRCRLVGYRSQRQDCKPEMPDTRAVMSDDVKI